MSPVQKKQQILLRDAAFVITRSFEAWESRRRSCLHKTSIAPSSCSNLGSASAHAVRFVDRPAQLRPNLSSAMLVKGTLYRALNKTSHCSKKVKL
jgi:hypothetical protein